MRLLIVKVNKLVYIITRRNRHVPAGDFARHSLWYPWKGYEHRWCEGITWQFGVCNDDWDDDSFLTKRSIRTIRVFWVCYARGPDFRRRRKIAFLVGFGAPVMPGGGISMRGDQNRKQNSKSRSCSWERARWSFLKVCLVYAFQRKTRPQNLEIYVKKRRLHAVPSCGSDRLKRHFREGSVAGISHIRKASAPRKPWNVC